MYILNEMLNSTIRYSSFVKVMASNVKVNRHPFQNSTLCDGEKHLDSTNA